MNGKELADKVRDIRNAGNWSANCIAGFEIAADLIERELDSYAIVKIVDCPVCTNDGQYWEGDPNGDHWAVQCQFCHEMPHSRYNNPRGDV